MSTAATVEHDASAPDVSERVESVDITDTRITFVLTDGRTVSVPLSWSWRLEEATPAERQNYEISPSGYGVHWPDVDEDLSARGMLRGTPAPRPNTAPPPETPPETPGDWSPGHIQKLRKELGLSQTEFANRMGIRQATVSDWETGKQQPSPMARRLLDRMAGGTRGKAQAAL